MKDESVAEIARRLARDAEAVCRHYLSKGRREGRYWLVGNVENSPGRSLYVRLVGPDSGKGAAGKWTDAATGEHGDLLDLITAREHLTTAAAIAEARRFLQVPRGQRHSDGLSSAAVRSPRGGSPEAARRLFRMGQPISGTLAERYLRHRGIVNLGDLTSLRFHPSCFYRDATNHRREWPALLAAITDNAGQITGVHRTWLSRDGRDKAPLATPRRAMGALLGNGARFGTSGEVMAAGEGIETMLSLKCALPRLPTIAALSANHLAALILPGSLRRLYIAVDEGSAGNSAAGRLRARSEFRGVEVFLLRPGIDDFNTDLTRLGAAAFLQAILPQLAEADRARFVQ